jgi:hypothetical protein
MNTNETDKSEAAIEAAGSMMDAFKKSLRTLMIEDAIPTKSSETEPGNISEEE